MALFDLFKKKEESACCCGIESIKVLGAGCKACRRQYENVKAAAEKLAPGRTVEYITDMERVMAYGVMRMPVIVINETVVSAGRVLKTEEVETLLKRSCQ